MTHQQQRARRIWHGRGRKARDEKPASRSAFEDFRGDAFALKDVREVFCRRDFVARRVRGVDANQRLKPEDGFALESGQVKTRGGSSLRWRGGAWGPVLRRAG